MHQAALELWSKEFGQSNLSRWRAHAKIDNYRWTRLIGLEVPRARQAAMEEVEGEEEAWCQRPTAAFTTANPNVP